MVVAGAISGGLSVVSGIFGSRSAKKAFISVPSIVLAYNG